MKRILTSTITILILAAAAFGFQGPRDPGAIAVQPASTQAGSTVPSTNLQIVLEGPMAICKSPGKDPSKITILIPQAKHHFSPGVDADLTEALMCPGEYSLDLPKDDQPRNADIVETPYGGQNIKFDYLKMNYCPAPGKKYLSLMLNKPDKIISMMPTYASIKVDGKPGDKYYYAARTMLYYYRVDLSKLTISKLSPPTDKCQIKVKTCWLGRKTVDLKYPRPLNFLGSGNDKWLSFSMTPSEEDDYSHSHGKHAYKDMSDMLGVNRSISFPMNFTDPLGPHNDCRVAQMLIVP